jgi:hypothetical protein
MVSGRKTQEVPFLFYAGSAFEGTWTRFMKAMVVVELALEMYASGYDIGARTHTHMFPTESFRATGRFATGRFATGRFACQRFQATIP